MPLCPGGRCAAGSDKYRGTALRVYLLRSLSRDRTLKSRPIELSSTAVCCLNEHRGQQTPPRHTWNSQQRVTTVSAANLSYRCFRSPTPTPLTTADKAPRLAPRVRYNNPRVWRAVWSRSWSYSCEATAAALLPSGFPAWP